MSNRYLKTMIFMLIDIIISVVAVLSAYRLYGMRISEISIACIHSMIIFPIVLIFIFYILNNYKILWRYAGVNDYISVFGSSVLSVVCLFIVQNAAKKDLGLDIAITICLITGILVLIERYLFKKTYYPIFAEKCDEDDTLSGNVLIIGGGEAGCAIIENINGNSHLNSCKVKCVIDDDPLKKGQLICGAKIVGGCGEIIPAVEKYNIDIIVFAIPSCTSERKSAILRICQKTNCTIRVLPSVYQMLSTEEVKVSALKKIEIEDLLGRDPISIGVHKEMKYVEDKVVLVTGGGGSIGSELCRQLAAHNPKQLIILDIYENNAYDIQNELVSKYPDLNLKTLIGSVRDSDRMDNIFEEYRPQIVYHAAAHKHVPLMEDSPNESIKNNVFGTFKTAQCADKYGAEKFVLISTDKAVNPTNIMGASKRICEMIVQTFNNRSDTEFVAVRFGNVLGSNGSVIPLFRKQIEQGGPVTVTDPNIIRYFMTIPEAVSLVLQAGASAKGGEIFVLDMGEPVKIIDLAENLIRLSGFNPYTDIKIEFTGLRPGEKLYEEMLMSEEGLKKTDNRLIFIGHPIDIDEDELFRTLDEMREVMYNDDVNMRALVKRIVPTYQYYPSDKEAVKS